MKIYYDCMPKGVCVALGAFDGIHIGHRKLIEKAVCYARERNLKSCVFTFDVLPSGAKCISDFATRNEILEKLGVDCVLIKHFDDEFKNTSAESFMEKYLTDASFLSVGFNFRFGKSRKGDVSVLSDFCRKKGIEINVCDPVCFGDFVVSSTKIRECVLNSNFSLAKDMLGRGFFAGGLVVEGNQIGRTIGFPTANIKIGNEQIMPGAGVFVSITEVDGKLYKSFSNYGNKPTFSDENVILETHLFDFDGDLYGKCIRVYFVEKIRDITKFASKEALRQQLLDDKNKSLDFFSKSGLQIEKFVV